MSGRVRIKWEFDEDATILRPEIPAEPDNNEKQITRDLEAIHNIITGNVLTTVFQPVFNRENGSVLGYEALTRLRKENPFGEIRELFLRALQTGCICALDCACLSTTLKTVHTLSLAERPEFLFVNTCPETLMNSSLFLDTCDNLIETFGISREKIVLEITEESMISNYAIFRQSLKHTVGRGIKSPSTTYLAESSREFISVLQWVFPCTGSPSGGCRPACEDSERFWKHQPSLAI
jgi:hypothetical protein